MMTSGDADALTQVQPNRAQSAERPYGYYAAILAVYNLLFLAFTWLYRRREHPLDRITPLDMVTLGLATLRLSKVVSEDEITAFMREPVVTSEDGQRRAQGHGLRLALGKLVACPTCVGTWVAAILTYSLHLWPRYTRPFLALMSASGMSQLGDALLSLVYTDRDVLRKKES